MVYDTGEQTQYWRSTKKAIVWLTRAIGYLVYFYVIVVEIILGLGFFLLLFGANPSSGFTEWVYRSLDRAMEPFRGIFTSIELGTTTGNEIPSVFDTSVLFAMIVYGILAVAIYSLVNWLSYRLARLERQEHDEQVATMIDQAARPRRASGPPPAPARPIDQQGAMPATGEPSAPPSSPG